MSSFFKRCKRTLPNDNTKTLKRFFKHNHFKFKRNKLAKMNNSSFYKKPCET